MRPLIALVVDDEPFARREIRHLLLSFPMIEVGAEAGNAAEAQRFLRERPFDILFLDVNLPGDNGITVAETASRLHPRPYIIFVTAYEEFALRAFEVAAHDYLLKPVPPQRFGLAMAHLLEFFHAAEANLVPPPRGLIDLFPVRHSADTIKLLPLEDIVVFEAERQYCRVHTSTESLLSSSYSLAELEELLPHPPFLRVHRSFIINLRMIEKIEVVSPSKYELRLRAGRLQEVPVSRRALPELKNALRL
ncbi:MAG: LytTR family DNA-binding domain-containing protein [Thermoleophilia bacterium]|nr:LytTR family DNA-binding domain-containing protein [Thermoleophilia bacterium]